MFLANQQFRKEYGNVGPTLIWLNLESKAEVDELYREWSGSHANVPSAPESKPWGFARVHGGGSGWQSFLCFL